MIAITIISFENISWRGCSSHGRALALHARVSSVLSLSRSRGFGFGCLGLSLVFDCRSLPRLLSRDCTAATAMLIPRLLRVGGQMLKELSKGRYLSISGTGYTRQHLRPLFKLPSETKAFQGSAFQKYHHFSTTAAGDACGEGSEQNDTYVIIDKIANHSSQKTSALLLDYNILVVSSHSEAPFFRISVTFVDKDGEEKLIKGHASKYGRTGLDGGACEGSLACSTCHVIVMDMGYYNKLEDPTDEENDMLDLAFGLTETSRLGCQIVAKPELDGIRVAIPAATRNFAVDGYVPKPH
ncbi:hypothetical protein JRO89_XS03G0306000 [Xanthoceras sorbifolium]|uniref:2Fe-2S ferredoxin-type domain-containing protein n=1 Tax=Xanthoceras sorbifolium TaxID=99658 RepID=A0ABQ8ID30_9ROSI|nr:hypothetical protein JRO89_XS03G0306000 [Xanthoceras sorbifolium]